MKEREKKDVDWLEHSWCIVSIHLAQAQAALYEIEEEDSELYQRIEEMRSEVRHSAAQVRVDPETPKRVREMMARRD